VQPEVLDADEDSKARQKYRHENHKHFNFARTGNEPRQMVWGRSWVKYLISLEKQLAKEAVATIMGKIMGASFIEAGDKPISSRG